MCDHTVPHRSGPDPDWLATWRADHAAQHAETIAATSELVERLGGHDDGWLLVDRLVSAKNTLADLEAEYALELLASHVPSLACAMRALAPHILTRPRDGASEWTCCRAIDRG